MRTENQFYQYEEIDISRWVHIKPLLDELQADHHERWPKKYAETVVLDKERYAKSFGIGCFVDGQMIGLCWGNMNDTGRTSPIAWVEDFIVSKGWRYQGIGTKLFRQFREVAKQRGATGLELCTESANADALQFYWRENLAPTCYIFRQTFE